MVVHSVHGIMFKDLKQILRKEQCDASILLTANVPSAKKIVVHGPEGNFRISVRLERILMNDKYANFRGGRHTISISGTRGNPILAIVTGIIGFFQY